MSDTAEGATQFHPKDLTFRQRVGVDPLPKRLAFGELGSELRHKIWDVIYLYFSTETRNKYTNRREFSEDARHAAIRVLRHVGKFPLDEAYDIARDPSKVMNYLKTRIYDTKYYDCLEIVTHFLQDTWSNRAAELLAEVFLDPTSAYIVVDFPPRTIMPRGTEAERDAFAQNWPVIAASRFDGGKTHLRSASECLNNGDDRGAIREAIHAVESAVHALTGNKPAKLGDALAALEKRHGLHRGLKAGFSSLYGYTSDERGVRHALSDAENENVGMDEALFMFSACAAFVAYLARKYPEL